MGVATCFPAQRLALFGKGLLEFNASTLGSAHHFMAGNLQQATVHRMGNGFFVG
jgi:hypothetical protein